MDIKQILELADTAACASLTTRIESLIKGRIRLEVHEKCPGEWWVLAGDKLMGSGGSPLEAIGDAFETATIWAARN